MLTGMTGGEQKLTGMTGVSRTDRRGAELTGGEQN